MPTLTEDEDWPAGLRSVARFEVVDVAGKGKLSVDGQSEGRGRGFTVGG